MCRTTPSSSAAALHVPVRWQGADLHTIVVPPGPAARGRVRQVQRLASYIEREVPPHALDRGGRFNDWGERLDGPMRHCGLRRASVPGRHRAATFPSSLPIFSLDRVCTRGLRCDGFAGAARPELGAHVRPLAPAGGAAARMSLAPPG